MRQFALAISLITFTGCGSSTEPASQSSSTPPQHNDATSESSERAQPPQQSTLSLAQALTGKRIHFQVPGVDGDFWADFHADGTSRHSTRGSGTYKIDGLKVIATDFEDVELVFPKATLSAGDTFQARVPGQETQSVTVLKVEPIPQVLQTSVPETGQETAGRRRGAGKDEGTPLHMAAEEGDVELARKLIASGADVNSLESQDGESPLHRAITRGNTEVAKLLIDSGADVNLGRKGDGQKPLEMAERRRRVEIVQLIRAKRTASPRKSRVRSAKLSPFSRVACQGDVAMVTYNGQPMELVSLNGLTTKRILDFCKQRYGNQWEKRFAEDLVEVLGGMGQKVGNTCSLVLKDASGKIVKVEQAKMTSELRQQVWRSRQEQPRSAIPQPFNRAVAAETLKNLHRAMQDRWAYFQANDCDFDRRFEDAQQQVSNGHFDGVQGRQRFQATLETLVGHGIDGHARVEVAGVPAVRRYLPFLIRPLGDRYVAFKSDRSGFLAPDTPYITHLGSMSGEMVAIESIVEYLSRFSPQGSPQYRKHQALRLIRRLDRIQNLLALQPDDQLRVSLQREDTTGAEDSSLSLSVSDRFPTFGSFPQKSSQLLEHDIGYLRIAAMDERAVTEIHTWMPRFREANGLIIDVRGNGGGRRTALLAIADFLIGPEESPVVANVAKYRLHADFPENHLANRFLFPATSDRWSQAEREAITSFQVSFQPEWSPPANKFSAWHYLVLSHQANPGTFHFDRPVAVLMDDRCFSATDIFLAAIKQIEDVTLVGTPSGGGSARSVSLDLRPARVRLASMASFQPDGKLFDGNGVQPDKVVQAAPDFFVGKNDRVLASAMQLLTN